MGLHSYKALLLPRKRNRTDTGGQPVVSAWLGPFLVVPGSVSWVSPGSGQAGVSTWDSHRKTNHSTSHKDEGVNTGVTDYRKA